MYNPDTLFSLFFCIFAASLECRRLACNFNNNKQ